jgi:ApbE superfamily uncharacterized protein (UPF0280 family)
MKNNKYQKRFYRNWVKAKDLCSMHIVEKETDLQVLTDKPVDEKFLREKIRLYRWQIENYISKDRRFLTSLKPVTVEMKAPLVVREMSRAAKSANVGPMAAVAGAIAQSLGRDLLKKGCREVIIENGGDIFLKIKQIRSVGVYAGKSSIFNRISLKIRPADTPLGVCSSSGAVGHSLSFGNADSVIVLSKNASLADAVATATGNLVKSKQDLNVALGFAKSINGVTGCAIIFKNNLISWGKIEFSP